MQLTKRSLNERGGRGDNIKGEMATLELLGDVNLCAHP